MQSTLALGRVALISGANRGIGQAVARRLYDDGYCVSLGARQPKSLASTALNFDRDRLFTHCYEAASEEVIGEWVRATVQKFGRIDVVVNNAGVDSAAGIEDDDEKELDYVWEVNVKGPLRLIRHALPYLRRSQSGRIINIVSLAGKRVRNTHVAYHMSKFALMALTHVGRRVAWEDGVRATAICPGPVNTAMADDSESIERERMTQPEDVAAVVAMVAALPNTASISEIPINCQLGEMF